MSKNLKQIQIFINNKKLYKSVFNYELILKLTIICIEYLCNAYKNTKKFNEKHSGWESTPISPCTRACYTYSVYIVFIDVDFF